MFSGQGFCPVKELRILQVDLGTYDDLLESSSKEVANG